MAKKRCFTENAFCERRGVEARPESDVRRRFAVSLLIFFFNKHRRGAR
jgi:hypothetical protein